MGRQVSILITPLQSDKSNSSISIAATNKSQRATESMAGTHPTEVSKRKGQDDRRHLSGRLSVTAFICLR